MNTGTAQSQTNGAPLAGMTLLTLSEWQEEVASLTTTASYWDWVQEHLADGSDND
jgi:hypothetical protein